uniref:Uncharacterized protein n=1 Tax=Arundo donax TaxID=35708 RepID=A0A0A9G4R9_ARUDO
MTNIEHFEHRTITKGGGNVANELIVLKVKHGEGCRCKAERRRYLSAKAVVACIERNQILRQLP